MRIGELLNTKMNDINLEEQVIRRNFSSHTIINYLSSIKQFVLWLDVPVEAVTCEKLSAYIDDLLNKSNNHFTPIIRKSKGGDIMAACGQLSGALAGKHYE
jgi:adenine C2-methylase RlmN of 23S rRNA A2503 and tRNA A37